MHEDHMLNRTTFRRTDHRSGWWRWWLQRCMLRMKFHSKRSSLVSGLIASRNVDSNARTCERWSMTWEKIRCRRRWTVIPCQRTEKWVDLRFHPKILWQSICWSCDTFCCSDCNFFSRLVFLFSRHKVRKSRKRLLTGSKIILTWYNSLFHMTKSLTVLMMWQQTTRYFRYSLLLFWNWTRSWSFGRTFVRNCSKTTNYFSEVRTNCLSDVCAASGATKQCWRVRYSEVMNPVNLRSTIFFHGTTISVIMHDDDVYPKTGKWGGKKRVSERIVCWDMRYTGWETALHHQQVATIPIKRIAFEKEKL